uniref:Uncharacterized protein n=1 Tax=Erpetoichthys calabaricus TaxID=27687 RepID=A0A8C4RI26_ERPCA
MERNSPLFKSDHTYTKQPAIQSVLPPVVLPRDHIGWSIINTVYMNFFCLGAVALYFSIKSRDRKVVGDLEGARYYGSKACCFNVTALAVSFLLLLLLLFITSNGALCREYT